MTHRRSRVAAALAAALLAATSVLAPGLVTGAQAAPATAPVQVTVERQSPQVVSLAGPATEVSFTLALHNTGTDTLSGLHLEVTREAPAATPAALDAQLADPQPSGNDLESGLPDLQVSGTLAAGQTLQTTYTVSVGPFTDARMCLCQDGGAYPLHFTLLGARTGASDGSDQLGETYTYLPTFFSTRSVKPLAVSWVWPLIDRPHRAAASATFTDDALAGEVASGGRLDRSLQVLERTASTVRMTVVLDPELIDELIAMTGGYTVTASGRSATGTGSAAAASWLARLRALVPHEDLSFTPVADPDLLSLDQSGQSGLVQPASADAALTARVARTLGLGSTSALPTATAWPAGGVLDTGALALARAEGATTMVLPDSSVVGANDARSDGSVPDGIAALSGTPGVHTAITSTAMQLLVSAAVARVNGDPTALPTLLAELAVRGAPDAGHSYAAVLTPPRWVDPDVASASATVLATAHNDWTTAEPLANLNAAAGAPAPLALRTDDPLPSVTVPARNLSAAATLSSAADDAAEMISTAARTTSATGTSSGTPRPSGTGASTADPSSGSGSPTTTSPTTNSATGSPAGDSTASDQGRSTTTAATRAALSGADALRSSAAAAGVRLASAGWSQDLAAAGAAASAADSQAASLGAAVSVVRPMRSYTLTSSDSPLLLTLRNELAYPVAVRVSVTGGPLGFSTSDPGIQQIPARGTLPLSIKTHIERSGRFQLTASLSTPSRAAVGTPIPVSVNSSALGSVGVIITAVALAVLVIALLVRLGLRVRRSRQPESDGAGRTA